MTPVQLARAIGGIASGGAMRRPHVVAQDQLSPNYRQAILDTYPGSGDANVPLDPATWETITDGMAEVTSAHGTAHASHLEGIDFAGKTGTAQVVNHSFGAKSVSKDVASRAHAWFVGVAPRRNPDIVVVVLWEHGGWGAGSAKLAAQVIQAYVDKQRRLDHNVLQVATEPKPNAQPAEQEPVKKTNAGEAHRSGSHLVQSRGSGCDGRQAGKAGARPEWVWGRQADGIVRAGHFFLNEQEIAAQACQAARG